MRDFVIMTDSASDMPIELIKKHDMKILGISCIYNDKEIKDDLDKSIDIDEFYESVEKGAMPITSMINPLEYIIEFEKIIKDDKDIIYICISSGMSGIYDSAMIARESLLNKYKGARIEIIDSLSVSLGEGILAYYACRLKEDGKSFDEVKNWLNSNIQNSQLWFMVDDLGHLKRGGRISGTQAMVGSLLDVKPIITAGKDGILTVHSKVRGKKRAIKTLLETFQQRSHNVEGYDIKNDLIYIAHAHSNVESEAKNLEEQIRKISPVKTLVTRIRVTIGSHTGPSAVGVAFLGNKRDELRKM